ncbi:hypothetical protein P171DRAFT_160681 [Karstenula rhodostoma CBS 690.94]|uniref:Protein kinase domain-containing protein n=1 Tax=Karstenula rhodostoma CBS 690.94 TaxID=1392251 RepID=A0A9P4P8H0_9PLEO|nr:hypothetical protein P171DRAFT_160681 [Karstenula rhodostoma CBS 690.94]
MSHDETPPTTALFCKQLRKHTITPAEGEGQPYVRTKDLVRWMTSTTGAQEPIAKRLLHQAYRNTSSQYGSEWYITYETICGQTHHRDQCIIAFSILLEIGLEHWVHSAQQQDIVDRMLPMQLGQLEEKFRLIVQQQGADSAKQIKDMDYQQGSEYARRFDEAQWKYFPVLFTLNMDKNFSEKQVFPICRKGEIGQGGQARVFQILVQADYVESDLEARLPKDEHTRFKDEEFGECFQLALKTFESASFPYWANEKQAFTALQQQRNKGMIQCLGCYAILRATTDAESSPFREMNILLEYGRFDLMGIFEHRNPPVNSPEIEEFWRSLIEVVDALRGIHDFKTQNDRYHGWHNDIKPENIIVVNDKYKLADPGFAKFKKTLEQEDGESLPKIIAHGGTATYAAPERYARKSGANVPVSQSVDLWSIGCIFSMAATWIVLGYQGIRQFDCIRQRAISNVLRQARDQGREPIITKGDFFHDGTDILSVVKDWHRYLGNSVRQTDHVTKKMLELTEDHLLIRNRTITAKKLYIELQELLEGCKKEIIPEGLENLMIALLDIDEEAKSVPETMPSRANVTNIGLALQKHPQKVTSRLEVPGSLLKTASRFESLSKLSMARPVKSTVNLDPSHASNNGSNASNSSTHQDSEHSFRERPVSMPPNPVQHRTSTYMSVRTDDGKTPDPINVIQAHERLSGRSIKALLSPREAREDQYVKAYCGNRDIKFLVDNSSSMRPYWAEATYLLEALVLMAKKSDKDGMDLYFTVPESRKTKERIFEAVLEGKKDEKQFRQAMVDKAPQQGMWTKTDIIAPLRTIFDEFLGAPSDQKQSKSKMKWAKKTQDGPKALTLLILTDGTWEGMKDPDAINNYIEELLKNLTDQGMIKSHTDGFNRFASIEFIQFGDDPTVTERLRALDDGMEFKGYQDIIDHEMFSVNGDVRKMLLGSFNPYMDESKKIRLAHEDSQTPTKQQTRHSMPPGSLNDAHLPGSTQNSNGSPLARIRTPTNSTGSSGYYTPPDSGRSKP